MKPFKSWKNKYLKYITKKQAQKYDLYNKTAWEISQYTKETVEAVKQKHKIGPQNEKGFNIFENQGGLTNPIVENFYKGCVYYLYELPLWNAECNRPRYLYLMSAGYLKRNQYKKVMDFGAGAGDLCIELARHNLDVTYCEIGDKTFNFAEYRFGNRKLPIKMYRGIEALKNEIYDCIFSFDVFEHLKNLETMIKKLVCFIRPGGSLIFSGAFSGGTLHLEENEKYNEFKQLDRLMRNSGLVFEDKFAQFYFYKKPMEKTATVNPS